MANKIKNKIKKKAKPKIKKQAKVADKRRTESVSSPLDAKIGGSKMENKAHVEESAHLQKDKIEKTGNIETDEPEKVENGDNNHLAKWTAPSFILTNGEVLIYKLSAVGSPLMIVWSLVQGNYIVSITFVLALAASAIHLVRKPEAMECLIDLDGIKMGDKLYKYNLIESFEVEEEPRVLKFKLKNAFFPVKEIYLEDQEPNYIRAVLEYFLPEEKQEAVLLSREKKGSIGEEEMSDEELHSYLEKMEKKIEEES
jgi:hypothetical protein